jgi:plastocyanin
MLRDRCRSAALTSVSVAALSGLAFTACGGSDAPASAPEVSTVTADIDATYSYTIPAGAGVALDAGEPLEILPAELDAKVGETIRIVNEDDRGHNVGPFFVGAGETVTQRFATAGEFVGVCTVHPSGQFVLVVSA